MNEVEAVKSKAEIEAVEMLMRKHRGDLYGDLWRIGVNMALRISDLLEIEYSRISFHKCEYRAIEGKTGKRRTITLNSKVCELIKKRRLQYPDDKYLFQVHSNYTASMQPKAVSRGRVATVFKEIGDIVGVQIGTHSMRKSRGYAMYSDGVPMEVIAKVLNHASTSTTMRYIGIDQQTVSDTYTDYVL